MSSPRGAEPYPVHAGANGTLTVLAQGDHIRPSRFILTLPSGYGPPVSQRHPHQTETMHIRSGQVHVYVDGVLRGLRQLLAQLNVLIEYPDNIVFHPLLHAGFRVLVGVARALGVLGPLPEAASAPLPVERAG